MAVVNQLNLNVGTEQNPNFVLHDINDKRISTTAVTTATHLLTCNSSVTSIAPITAANLASVLGATFPSITSAEYGDFNDLPLSCHFYVSSVEIAKMENRPSDTYGFGWCLKINNSNFMQIFFGLGSGGNAFQYRKAFKSSGSAAEWSSWKTIATTT